MAVGTLNGARSIDGDDSGAGNANSGVGGAVDGNGDGADTSGDGSNVIRPGDIGAINSGAGGAGGGGRKRRSDAGKSRGPRGSTEKADKADLAGIGEIIGEIHEMLAFISGIPEFALTEQKSEKLAKAIERVARHYDIPILDPVTRDWFMLLKSAGIIYGGAFMAYAVRTRGDKARVVNPMVAPKNPTAPVGTTQADKVQQATAPRPAPAPQNQPAYARVVVPGFEHLGPQQVRVN